MNAEADELIQITKESTMDYVFEMLSQLAGLCDRCDETKIAQALRTLAAGHARYNGGTHTTAD